MIQAANKPASMKANLAAVENGIRSIRDRLLAEIEGNPAFFGSVSVNFQVSGGVIDRFRVSCDENVKCGTVSA